MRSIGIRIFAGRAAETAARATAHAARAMGRDRIILDAPFRDHVETARSADLLEQAARFDCLLALGEP